MNIQEFEKQMKISPSSPKTIQSYVEQINPFLKFCNGEVTQENIDNYMINRRENVAPSTCNLFLNALKKYCEYANLNFQLPKQKDCKPKEKPYWTIDELKEKVIQYTAQLFNNYSEIDLLFYIMFFTGLRPEEICNLQIKDVEFEKQLFRIINGKGGKDRIIPFLNNGLTNKLKKYILSLERKYLFNINKTQLKYLFDKIQDKLGFDYEVSPYIMRRSFARYYYKASKNNILAVQRAMGHNNIKTTMRYIQFDDKMLIETGELIRNGDQVNELEKAKTKINSLEKIIEDLNKTIKNLIEKLQGK